MANTYGVRMDYDEVEEIRKHYYVLELDIMAQDGNTRREHNTFVHILELDFDNIGSNALHRHIHELFTKYKRNHEVLMKVEIIREFWR